MALGDLSDPETVTQLAAKHPVRREHEHLPGAPAPDRAHIRPRSLPAQTVPNVETPRRHGTVRLQE